MANHQQLSESEKLSRHLTLLREEYVKLQQKYADIERKYNLLAADRNGGTDSSDQDTFIARLLRTVANLFEQELYSDLSIRLKHSTVHAHKFILSSRSDEWGVLNLNEVSELDWTDIQQEISYSLLRWVYTDQIQLYNKGDDFVLNVMRVARRFKLMQLQENCEKCLMSSINVHNCVKFYQTADEISATNLKNHCSELISMHWNDFTPKDFVHMNASLLFTMFKSKTKYPLHTAIRLGREDVVFLYMVEFNDKLSEKLNEIDDQNEIPLDLALKTNQESIAKHLLESKANVNLIDAQGKTLLIRAIERQDRDSIKFLIDSKASVDIFIDSTKESPLHLICSITQTDANMDLLEVAKLLLDNGANPNLQDNLGNSCLHRIVIAGNLPLLVLLLEHGGLHLDVFNLNSQTPLEIALNYFQESKSPDNLKQFANLLVEHGASVNSIEPRSGDSLLHVVARSQNQAAALFLIERNAKVNTANQRGETALHFAAMYGLLELLRALLDAGADANVTTRGGSNADITVNGSIDVTKACEKIASNLTPLHYAVLGGHEKAVRILLKLGSGSDYGNMSNSSSLNSLSLANKLSVELNVKDSLGRTPLQLALQNEQSSIAQFLIDEGADVNITDVQGYTMLHRALIEGDSKAAILLLSYGADINLRTPDNQTPLQLAVEKGIESVVVELCSKGADIEVLDNDGNTPLWNALINNNENIASYLVQFNCDTNCWSQGQGKYLQNYLHKALDENNQSIACFLIRSGCDMNKPRRPLDNLPADECDEEASDGQTPLHIACQWGHDEVVQTLLEHGADVNLQDTEGRTPLHVAIANEGDLIIQLLLSHPQLKLHLKNRFGQTAFAIALESRNNKAAQNILNRDPQVAEKVDGKGRNFLHNAILKSDKESVLFLLSINVNIQSRVQDPTQFTPLHLAMQIGGETGETIVRSLLLVGANVNELSAQKQSPLHIAAEHKQAKICSILLEQGVNFELVDLNLNNAMHIACQQADLETCKVLIEESNINTEAINLRGQNPLHLLSQSADESAAEIFELLLKHIPKYPLNKQDAEGNSPLLLAYGAGNVSLCKLLIRYGACVGACNKSGINIFNYQAASKTLLYKLLDALPQESPWTEGDQCQECGARFGITSRKHHCRHCGRLLCAKCSAREMPIPKFNLTKPVRICEICNDVLSLGFQY